jgi:glycosyltransferase involved in cell wall biosynthesis
VTAVHVVVPEGIDDPSRPSGGNTYDRRVCRGLAAAGWEVHLREVPGSWPQPDASSYAALAGALSGIRDGAVVLVDGLVASPAADILPKAADRLRLVVLVHMPLGQDASDARERENAVLSAAAAVVTTSTWARGVLLNLYSLPRDRVHVAEPGVDPADVAPGTESGGALLCVAAVVPGKGHDVLLDALAMLSRFRWHCLCVGSLERDAEFAADVRRRVRDSGLEGSVHFSGPQDEVDLAHSYGTADLLVLPSRSESYGMVVTEALARGLPVVAADVGGVPEALGHGADGTRPGILVPHDQPAALRDALTAWLDDAHLRRRLRRAAYERRAALTRWSTTTSAVADVLAGAAR